MNFWAAQKRARSKTTLYLVLFIVLTLAVASAAEFMMRGFAGSDYSPPFPFVGLLFSAITFLTAGIQYGQFSLYGGSYVAEAVGAQQVDPSTKNPNERRLLNIVQEIAIASSLPVPPVYILRTKQINAFAAGLTKDNAAIAVTEGTLLRLNRDELQGVIAHEFGHIYNGDMKISMRLAAMCMGFFFVLYIAMRLLQFSDLRGRDDREGKGNSVMLAALVLMIAGAFTYLFGSILKAAVSREREYLADACAVQFTRNPDGIANALRKIASASESDTMPKEGMSFSHLYFDDRAGFSSIFATHPPLKNRIEAIEGRVYLPEEWKEGLPPASGR
ncbi:MAG: M48 family metallopeptidase [Parachlamydiaceae bacterium]|nr:M48 family metallopeptidase [Parachlamydiaceae bacterium]